MKPAPPSENPIDDFLAYRDFVHPTPPGFIISLRSVVLAELGRQALRPLLTVRRAYLLPADGIEEC